MIASLENLSPAVALLALCTILLMVPMDDENRPLSIVCAILSLLMTIALPTFGVPARYTCASVLLIFALYLALRTYSRYRREFTVSSKRARSLRVRCEARMFYSTLCFISGFLTVVFEGIVPELALAAPLAALSVLLAARVITGRPLFIHVRVGKDFALVAEEYNCREISLKQLYEKTVAYIEEKKPYANSPLPQSVLARTMGVSVKDLSKAISVYSKDTYPLFIKRYRVKYAMDLMSRDPMLKVTEVGRLSGFQSESTFLDAFKEIEGVTPSEHLRHLRYKQKREASA